MFAGLSTLRAKEKEKKPPSEAALKLQAYLAQQYGADAPGAAGEAPKKKKKKKKAEAGAGGAVRIVDQDVSGFAAVRQRGAAARGPAAAAAEEEEDDEGALALPFQYALAAVVLSKPPGKRV